MKALAVAFALVYALLCGIPAHAVEPDEILPDPAKEARARDISQNLRCLVCQNQSIDDSNAELARDLRVLVRERISAGDTNDEVVDYVVSRYGDFVLLQPPFKTKTLGLWIGPAIILSGGLAALIVFFRRRSNVSASPPPLTEEEKRRLAKLMGDPTP